MNFLNSIPILLIVFQIVLFNCRVSGSMVSCVIGINRSLNIAENAGKLFSKTIEEDVVFHLYTRLGSGSYNRAEIAADEISLCDSGFNFSHPTKIITHGYSSSEEGDAVVLPRDALMNTGDFNIITVNWKVPILYDSACEKVPLVAEHIAKLIDFLESHGMDLKQTTLIGHSLGAHVMGIAASKTKNKIELIVGLDPALPYFEENDPRDRLSPDDAKTVYVIHTNAGHCGISYPLGHYDFYPNGGQKQPGCIMNPCAHSRASELYAESIQKDHQLTARLCPDLSSAQEGNCFGDLIQMPDDLEIRNIPEGIYYVRTRESSPFGLGDFTE